MSGGFREVKATSLSLSLSLSLICAFVNIEVILFYLVWRRLELNSD